LSQQNGNACGFSVETLPEPFQINYKSYNSPTGLFKSLFNGVSNVSSSKIESELPVELSGIFDDDTCLFEKIHLQKVGECSNESGNTKDMEMISNGDSLTEGKSSVLNKSKWSKDEDCRLLNIIATYSIENAKLNPSCEEKLRLPWYEIAK
jgi:hypothetical protein